MHDNAGPGEIIKLFQTFCVMGGPPDRRRFSYFMRYISTVLVKLVIADRLKKGLNQNEYAELIGVSQPTISKLERNISQAKNDFDYHPDITTLCKFCLHFKRPIQSFFTSK